MVKLWNALRKLGRKEEGQSLVEYGLIITLIAVVVVVALTAMGGQLGTLFNNITKSL